MNVPVYNTKMEKVDEIEVWEPEILTQAQKRENAYSTWTSDSDGTPFYAEMTCDQMAATELTKYTHDKRPSAVAKLAELEHVYSLQKQAIEDAFPDETTTAFAAYTGNNTPVEDIPVTPTV